MRCLHLLLILVAQIGCSDLLLRIGAHLFALIGCSYALLIDAHIFWAQDPALCIFI